MKAMTAIKGTTAMLPLAILASCGGPAQRQYERQLEEAPAAAVHGVQGDRLQELMRGFDRLMNERLPQSMDVGLESSVRSKEIARIADELARSADQMSENGFGRETGDGEAFDALARELGVRARELEEAARENRTAELQARAAAIETVCAECHEQFRVDR